MARRRSIETSVQFDPGKRMLRLLEMFRREGDLLPIVGEILAERARDSFRLQRRGSRVWSARGIPNVAGIVSDLNAGRAPKPNRFQSRPALVDTGRLRDSIRARVATGGAVQIFTTVRYGRVHQEGGISKIALTASGRKTFAAQLRKQRAMLKRGTGGAGALAKAGTLASLGWLFARPKVSIKIRKRPFLLLDGADAREVERRLVAHVNGETTRAGRGVS
jgi:phage gpG-like protein